MGLSFRLGLFQRERMIERRKRRRRRRHDLVVAPEIPTDLVVAPEIPTDLVIDEILTRLPSKSLMRFKCVSKLWSSIISSQYFANRFLMVPSNPRLYLISSVFGGNYDKSVILSSAPNASTRSSFRVDQHLTIPQMRMHSQTLNGFMCYFLRGKAVIYNPATRQLVTLPAVPSRESKDKIHYCFGHDPVNDQYKVICSIGRTNLPHSQNAEIMSEHWVYVLKPGSFWKGFWKKTMDFCPNFPLSRGLSINGIVYYWALFGMHSYVVVSFDIISEEFKIIQAPSKDSHVNRSSSLVEYGGKLAALNYPNLRNDGLFDLCVLEDDAGNKEWSRETLVLKPCQLHLVNNFKLKIKGTTQSGKVILTPEVLSSPFNVFCYDMQSNDMTKIELKGIPQDWFSNGARFRLFEFMFMDQSESIVHLKT